MKQKKPLTPRQRKAISNLAKGMSITSSLIDAGYSPKTADKSAYLILNGESMKKAISVVMEKKGLSDDRLVEKLSDGLDSQKIISAVIVNGEPKEAGSKTNDFVEVPDMPTRHKYLETALKLKGHLRDKIDVDVTVETFEQRVMRLRGLLPAGQ